MKIRILTVLLLTLLVRIGSAADVESSVSQKLYHLIPPKDSSIVGLFVKERPRFSKIVGYSILGHIFLYAPKDNEYVVFYPYRQAGKSYGSFKNIEAFETEILRETSFESYVLQPDFVNALKQKLGQLQSMEVFIPEPYFAWDSTEVNDFGKGDVWVMLELTNQILNE